MKVAVVGAGRIAEQHLRVLREIEGLEVGVCDRSPAAAEFAAERFALPRHYDDFERLLDEMRPDVVHVTTPVDAHVALASRALARGAHVLVEKPIAPCHADWLTLCEAAASAQRWLIEDQPYPFSPPVQRVLRLIESGEFGEVVHVDAMICLDLAAPGSVFADVHAPHPSHAQPGGPISDFLTHLASLCSLFVGPHAAARTLWRKRNPQSALPFDEMRALVEAERGTATLAFSASSRPDAFAVCVQGTRMTAAMSLFEGGLSLQRRWPGNPAWTPLANGIATGGSHAADALRSLHAKLSGRPLVHEGLRELIRRFYSALRAGAAPPLRPEQIDAVSRLMAELTAGLAEA
ncbi:MAG TPA: Gfo/Idh/MocA family oxidoreductase [Myxococcota bacterium]